MAAGLKYAILDTDFVFKANIIKSETSALADEVLKFPDYQFFCHQKSYGEVKAFVLVQALRLLYDMEAYIFCSDDFGARQGFVNGAQIETKRYDETFMDDGIENVLKYGIACYKKQKILLDL